MEKYKANNVFDYLLEKHSLVKLKQQLEIVNKVSSIQDANKQLEESKRLNQELNDEIAQFEVRTQLGSVIHKINEDVFNSSYIKNYNNLLSEFVDKNKEHFSNSNSIQKYYN